MSGRAAKELVVVQTSGQPERVVCLHGLGRTRRCWGRLRRQLERAGYHTDAWTYPSFGRSIEWLGRDCRIRLAALSAVAGIGRLHLVTHSLGGIVVRSALAEPWPDAATAGKLGTVIMLAPPNCGSAWARRLGPWLGWAAPALPQLSDAPDSFVNRLPPLSRSLRVVVIAAARDGKCPLATTHLPGEAAHITVPGRHTFIMYRRDVADAILRELGKGSGIQRAMNC